jgi:hypothetical protein
LKLTSYHNGLTIQVDRDKIDTIGPHTDGGSVVNVNNITYHVTETVKEILRNDR